MGVSGGRRYVAFVGLTGRMGQGAKGICYSARQDHAYLHVERSWLQIEGISAVQWTTIHVVLPSLML